MGLFKYLKAAFIGRWNLLIFLGSCGFAAISGHADIALPLVLAGETAYLGFLGTHPRFQKSVDAREAKANRQDGTAAATATAKSILKALPKNLVTRFEAVRSRCAELRQLARQIRDPDRSGEPQPLEDLQLAGLDRLLWMYLRILFTQFSLTQFLRKTSSEQIEDDIRSFQARLEQFPASATDARQQRLRKVVEENLQTSQARLANYKKAEENCELMGLELERLENTIHSLSESAVNRQEPEFISGQIDQAAASMVQTERTMGELQFVTGLKSLDDDVPEILRSQQVAVEE
ncbi:MAG: hypothetical protein HY290_25460 [Planctomycetia bacterium]|nr:hypothetical protein [Planctomycetia bacterium]